MTLVLKLLYQVLIYVAAGVMFTLTVLRSVRDPQYRDRIPERLGFTRLRFSSAPIWIHAASVGEVQAAMPLIKRLLANTEHRPLLVTTTTPTGAARVKAVFDQQLQHAFLPYDTLGAVGRFIRRLQPHCLIIVETELWPNLLNACVNRGLPVVLASARISAKTASRYRYARSLFSHALPQVFVAAQTLEDAQRYRALGALPERIHITGNLKFDIQISESTLVVGKQIKQMLQSRPVWIAASTHAGEEEAALQAHRQVLLHRPTALLIIVPRHPQRFAQVAHLLSTQQCHYALRSASHIPTSEHSVWLIDTLGELLTFYAVSDVVFVGGTLVPVGGHNVLEPAALSLPILVGPHVFNSPDIANAMQAKHALTQVSSSQELSDAVIKLFNSPNQRADMGKAASRVVAEGRGALTAILELLREQAEIDLP